MKAIAFIASLLLAIPFRAQVACDILNAGPLQGSYAHTWAEPAAGSWDTPNMLYAANRVIGDLVRAQSGGPEDSLACSPLINPTAVAGKVALLYRGTCDYALKAKHCQEAGAIAVVIINNVQGPPVEMGGGPYGPQVTIPVFQITLGDGEAWMEAIESGATLSLLLGNKDGYYAVDAGVRKQGVLLPNSLALPALLASQPGDHAVGLGAMVHNFGSEDIAWLALHAVIEQDGESVYDEATLPFALAPGDSVLAQLPDWTQPAFSGNYQLTYNVVALNDQHVLDNQYTVPLHYEDRYALAPVEQASGAPVSTVGTQPAQSAGAYESCIHFRDTHASRIAVTGMDRQVSVSEPLTIAGDGVITRVYEWQDPFVTMDDPGFGFSQLSVVHDEEHVITASGNSAMIHFPFTEPLLLQDNARYLFCTVTSNPTVFFGFHEHVHYGLNETVYGQPTSPISNGGNWFIGFTGGPVASLGLRTADAASIGIEEAAPPRLSAYPNPSAGVFHLVIESPEPVQLIARDALGREMLRQRASAGRAVVDLSGRPAGVYMLSMQGSGAARALRLVVE
jgi:hypothetical protein